MFVRCTGCGKNISHRAPRCPFCGQPREPSEPVAAPEAAAPVRSTRRRPPGRTVTGFCDHAAVADEAVEEFREYGVNLDYSSASLAALDVLLAERFGVDGIEPTAARWKPNEEHRRLIALIGSYAGEVVRFRHGGHWLDDPEHPGKPLFVQVDLGEIGVVWPLERAYRRLKDGEAESLYAYAEIIDNESPSRPSPQEDAVAWASQATDLARRDRVDAARAFVDTALQLAPESSDAWFARGLIDERVGDVADARLAYEQALRFDTTGNEAIRAHLQSKISSLRGQVSDHRARRAASAAVQPWTSGGFPNIEDDEIAAGAEAAERRLNTGGAPQVTPESVARNATSQFPAADPMGISSIPSASISSLDVGHLDDALPDPPLDDDIEVVSVADTVFEYQTGMQPAVNDGGPPPPTGGRGAPEPSPPTVPLRPLSADDSLFGQAAGRSGLPALDEDGLIAATGREPVARAQARSVLDSLENPEADGLARDGAAFASSGRFSDAINCFVKAIEASPGHRDARIGLATAELACSRPEDALEAIAPLVARGDRDAVLIYVRAQCAQGEYADALTAIERLSAAAQEHVDVSLARAESLLMMQSFDAAATSFQRALRLEADTPRAWRGLARACVGRKDYRGARLAYATYIGLEHPSQRDAIQAAQRELAKLAAM